MRRLTYGNTNTFFIDGAGGGLLVDTGYAGTLPAFWKALKQNGLRVKDIAYVMATHYHPDHMGLIGELMKQGAKLLLPDVQRDFVHFSDDIFARDGLSVTPVDETEAAVISCGDSREFLRGLGISGEIINRYRRRDHQHTEPQRRQRLPGPGQRGLLRGRSGAAGAYRAV